MNNKGLSFLELMLAVIIFLVVASWVTTNYRKTVEHKRLQTTTDKLYAELKGLRAIGFKEDAGVIVKFVSTQCCSIYIDTNAQAPLQPYKKIAIPNPVEIGVASDGPYMAPTGIEWGESGVSPGWKSGLRMNNSPIGEFNVGAIYLRNIRLNKYTYCIGVSFNNLVFDLYKLDGKEWINCKK